MVMEEENNDDEEISIDFGKIANFFKKKKSKLREVKKIEEEAKEVKEEIKQAEEDKPKEELNELKKEEQKITTVEKELAMEEERAEDIDRQSEALSRDVKEIKEEIKEVKQDVASHEDKEDDEISIDFTKIKTFFKGLTKSDEKKESEDGTSIKTEPSKTETSESESDDEISFDFGKVKSFFKGSGKEEKSSDDEDISIDWKSVSSFFVKYRVVLLLLIPLILSIFLRVQSANLPITDDWARNNVYGYYRNQVKAQINQQYPNLPDQNKEVLVEKEFQSFLSTQGSQLDQQIKATSEHFKSRLQNENGVTYLLAIDPYFWTRHARNIIENGHPGDELRDGKPYDTHMYAPIGRPVPPDMFHAYLEAYSYKFFKAFNKDLDLMKVAFYMPVILATLAIIPAFFIARRLGGNFGGTVAAIIVAIHPAFLTRTAGGFSDTDAYNVLFPLLITWLFLEAFEAKDRNKKMIFGSLAGFFTGMYSSAWGGWWYILYFIIAMMVIYLGYYCFIHRNELKRGLVNFIDQPYIKNTLFVFLCFIVSSIIFTTMFTGFHAVSGLIRAPVGFVKMKEVGITTVWPNVFTTVAEQNPASLSGVISQIGFNNWFLFLIGISGLILAVMKKRENKSWFIMSSIVWYALVIIARPQNLRIFIVLVAIPVIARIIIAAREDDKEIDIKYSILLTLWMLSTIYASVKGIRFTLLLVPAFAVSFGITVGLVYTYLSKWISKELNIHKIITRVSIILLISLLLISPFKSAMATSKNEIPSMNEFSD
ncbi:STT3 domain-containing protein [Nanoarchaeota archaeon]